MITYIIKDKYAFSSPFRCSNSTNFGINIWDWKKCKTKIRQKKELKLLNRSWDLETKEVAKIGMSASLAIVVGTSFAMKSKAMKTLHVGAGIALVGFSLASYALSTSEEKNGWSSAETPTEPVKPKRARKFTRINR